jgi:hypothetical protein
MKKLFILFILLFAGCSQEPPRQPTIDVTITENNQEVSVFIDYASHLRHSGEHITANVSLTNLKEMDDYTEQLEFALARVKTARARLVELQHPQPEKPEKPR